jgi:lysozyme family protein
MADFKIAWSLTSRNEGGQVNDPSDPGGNTYCGITQKNYPSWPGWAILARWPYKYGQILPQLEEAVEQFYVNNFWVPIWGDRINDQNIANITFDMAVNKGLVVAIEALQDSAGIAVTGAMDQTTLDAINNPKI